MESMAVVIMVAYVVTIVLGSYGLLLAPPSDRAKHAPLFRVRV